MGDHVVQRGHVVADQGFHIRRFAVGEPSQRQCAQFVHQTPPQRSGEPGIVEVHAEQQHRGAGSAQGHDQQGRNPNRDELIHSGATQEKPGHLGEQNERHDLHHGEQGLRQATHDQRPTGRGQDPHRGGCGGGRHRGLWFLFPGGLLQDTRFAHGTPSHPVGVGVKRGPVQPELAFQRGAGTPGREGLGGDPGVPAGPVPPGNGLRQALPVGQLLHPAGLDVRALRQRQSGVALVVLFQVHHDGMLRRYRGRQGMNRRIGRQITQE